MTKEKVKQQFHYFSSSCLNWVVDESLEKWLKKQRKVDTNKSKTYKATIWKVYKVPLPISAHYSIDEYMPEVEGVKLIDKITY